MTKIRPAFQVHQKQTERMRHRSEWFLSDPTGLVTVKCRPTSYTPAATVRPPAAAAAPEGSLSPQQQQPPPPTRPGAPSPLRPPSRLRQPLKNQQGWRAAPDEEGKIVPVSYPLGGVETSNLGVGGTFVLFLMSDYQWRKPF